jgi:hypothetical protein
LAAAAADFEQVIQCMLLPIGQSVGEPTPELSLRAGSYLAAESFDHRQRRTDGVASAKLFE